MFQTVFPHSLWLYLPLSYMLRADVHNFFAQNQLEQPCPIIKQIAAGETPAAKCPYLSPGCKITAVNRQSVKGLSFEEMKTMLQKAQITVVLSIEEPLGLLQGKNSPSPRERYTWPVEE